MRIPGQQMRLALHCLPWLLGTGFVLAAGFFHWLGPLCGRYDFQGSLDVLFSELNHGQGWFSMLALVVGLCVLTRASVRSRPTSALLPSLLQSLVFDALVCGLGGVPLAWWNLAAMGLMSWGVLMYAGARRSLVYLVVAVSGYLLIGYAFTVLKAAVFLRGDVFDVALARVDRAVFGFSVYREVANWVQAHDWAMQLADHAYLQLFTVMLFNLLACAWLGGEAMVRRYGLALMCCYVLGVAGYLLVPAYGPFVHGADAFAHGWSDGEWRVAEIQRFILARTQDVGACRDERIAPFAFVAAMPSLHVAVPALGTAMMWGRWRAFAWSLLPLFLTIYAALATGMHYGVDALVGMALAACSVWLASGWVGGIQGGADPRAF